MNTKFLVIRFLAIITIASSFCVSCDDDISDVGASALVGSELEIIEHINYGVNIEQIDLTSDNPPRTNNLDYYLLGDKNNGLNDTKYSIVTRFLGLQNPPDNTNSTVTDDDGTVTITETKNIIQSATLVIPYIYTNETDSEDVTETNRVYSISKVEKGTSPLNIKVYKLDLSLLETDPRTDPISTSTNVFEYFADGSTTAEDYSVILDESSLIGELDGIVLPAPDENGNDFEFDVNIYDSENEEFLEAYEINQGLDYTIRIPLDSDFISDLNRLIYEDGDENYDISIFSDEALYDELKSIYITSTSDDGGVAGVMLAESSLFDGGIELVFETEKTVTENGILNEEDSTTDDDDADDWQTTSMLSFSGNPINIFTKKTNTVSEIANTVVLESGLGSIASLTLFNDNDELKLDDNDDYETLLEQNILLNDAVLRFTVNTDEIEIDDLPNNIFIAVSRNGSILLDYQSNLSSSDEDNESLKQGHLSSLVVPENDYPYYEINITEHLANILRQDSEEDAITNNLKLVLSVTEDLNTTSASRLKNDAAEEYINQGSLLCFKSVPLFSASSNEETRPRLTIKYTPTK